MKTETSAGRGMNATDVRVGQKVTTSGYAGTVTAICEWSRSETDVMVEVRLARGTCCVSCRDLRAAQ
jgi:hypothetical protein